VPSIKGTFAGKEKKAGGPQWNVAGKTIGLGRTAGTCNDETHCKQGSLVSVNPQSTAARGIARSLRIYYRDKPRASRMDALNAVFARPGGMVFDIGAHVGDRVASFRRLGCRVVAVEPQPAAMRALRLLYRHDNDVTLLPVAISAVAGNVKLHINTHNPTISTLSPAFIAAANTAPGWTGQHWDRVIDIQSVTLDDLVARHGAPDFVKIDVEGFEAEAIAGLSHPLRALSFEFTTIQRDCALDALSRLVRLGDYAFNVSIGERHVFEHAEFMSSDDMAGFLRSASEDLNSGDVYARLR